MPLFQTEGAVDLQEIPATSHLDAVGAGHDLFGDLFGDLAHAFAGAQRITDDHGTPGGADQQRCRANEQQAGKERQKQHEADGEQLPVDDRAGDAVGAPQLWLSGG
jgi:hypothetical protein